MQEITSSPRSIRIAPAVFLAALSLAFLAGWFVGLAPDYLSVFGKFIVYGVSIPVCLVLLAIGLIKMIGASDLSGISSAAVTVSYVLSPDDLARWRSIKRGMDRHEVTAILGQPDGPPVVVSTRKLGGFYGMDNSFDGMILYKWGSGSIYFEPNAGPVFHVKIPEYV